MNEQSLVLSDELLSVFFDFKQGKVDDPKLVEKFFSYYSSYLTNTAQLQRIGRGEELLPQLSAQNLTTQSLEELAMQTRYKLILNTRESDYPYVNINKDKVEKNFSLRFQIGERRDKAVQLISALCSDARFILIFDSYFCDRWNGTQKLFQQIIPNKSLTLLHDDHLTRKVSEIKKINANWTIKHDKKNTFSHAHDRYLLIDDKIEIMLSSGFDNLFSTDKDLTCVIRYKD
ncbi:MAG: hypothetical protein A6F70_09390 [Cycloclasticus sp. symbiont of Bathymodiolus heckerae]|nr:MAG: hypothetical protein A6F70_09390 [Cycloclasticus sp. symbiont of Bathymodiolus heckerae]